MLATQGEAARWIEQKAKVGALETHFFISGPQRDKGQ
jgi:hypothetical protein